MTDDKIHFMSFRPGTRRNPSGVPYTDQILWQTDNLVVNVTSGSNAPALQPRRDALRSLDNTTQRAWLGIPMQERGNEAD